MLLQTRKRAHKRDKESQEKRCHSKDLLIGLGDELAFGKCRPGHTTAKSQFKLAGVRVKTEISLRSCLRHQTQVRAWVLLFRKVPLGRVL